MSDRQLEVISAESDRLIALAGADEEVRTALRALASRILAATSDGSPSESLDLFNTSVASPIAASADAEQEVPCVDFFEPMVDGGATFEPIQAFSVAPAPSLAPAPAEVPALPPPVAQPTTAASSEKILAGKKPELGSGSTLSEPRRALTLGHRPGAPQGPAEPLRELTLGGRPGSGRVVPAQPGGTPANKNSDELSRLEARCYSKADAARRAARRIRQFHETLDDPLDDPPSDADFADWADRLTDDLYFGDHFDATDTSGIERLENLGGCFEAMARAVSLADRNQSHPKKLERVLPLFAEAQSALRVAMRAFREIDDPDQREAFEWVKDATTRYQTYVKRYMRLDDPAEPAAWPDLVGRLEKLGPKAKPKANAGAATTSRLDHVSVAIDRLRQDTKGGADSNETWQAIVTAVDEQVRGGLPPSNRELRELLLPIVDSLPESEDLPPAFRLVLREIDRFVDATAASALDELVNHEPTAEVTASARLLSGRSIVLIGGSRRHKAEEALERAFGLGELIWVETKEHQSVSTFEPLVSRRDVALVLLAIRWSSHSFGDVKQLCDLHAKPLVRLPGGYSPNQVAAQIVAQSSDQLGSE
jgi:hypothetical protein